MTASLIFRPGVLETSGLAYDIVFTASGRFLVADDQVFEVGKSAPVPLGVDSSSLVAHPTKDLIAAFTDEGVNFVELEGKRRVTHVKLEDPSAGAFDSRGESFAVSSDSSHELYVMSLDGSILRTLKMPDEDDTGAALVFGPKDASLLAFTDDQRMVTLPLDGSAPSERKLAKVKVLSGRALRINEDRIFFYDTANAAMLSSTGEVLWTSRLEKEGVAFVRSADAIAFVRLNKRSIGFYSVDDGKEIGAMKIAIEVAPLGFACHGDVLAWARDGAVEVVAVPKLPKR